MMRVLAWWALAALALAALWAWAGTRQPRCPDCGRRHRPYNPALRAENPLRAIDCMHARCAREAADSMDRLGQIARRLARNQLRALGNPTTRPLTCAEVNALLMQHHTTPRDLGDVDL